MLTEHQRHWGVDQWAAFLTTQTMPCMPRSKLMLRALEEVEGEDLAAADLTSLVISDPYLCLRLLREAERRRSHRLGHDTTTPLAAVMQLGVKTFRELLLNSPEADASRPGLAACEARAVLSSQIAQMWGKARADIAPDEVAMAALLAEIGELLLWNFAPELPQAAQDALASGRASRSAEAQELACGFRFRELSLKCATLWALPPLLIQLIRGTDNIRANVCKLYLDTARHLVAGADNAALPDDLVLAKQLIPHASLEWLAAHMNGLDATRQANLIAAVEQIFAQELSELQNPDPVRDPAAP
jgi:HD-like signal output (HDOD) protein